MVEEAHYYNNLTMFQFLIGKVKLGDDEITAVAVLCQFLIGKVKHVRFGMSGMIRMDVSIPHR